MKIPDNGQQHAQPDGHRVRGDGQVDVEQKEAHPATGVLLRGRHGGRVQAVEMDGERDVTEHRDDVRDGQACEDLVDGSAHVPSGEDRHVERVGHDAAHADEEREVAVVGGVPVGELLELLVHHMAGGVGHREAGLGLAADIVLKVPGRRGLGGWGGGGGKSKKEDKKK